MVSGLLLSLALLAAPSAESNVRRAAALFEQSRVAYQARRYDEALELLRGAYALHPEPVILYNMGRAYEGLKQSERALESYTRYLEAAPSAPDRTALEARLAELRAKVAPPLVVTVPGPAREVPVARLLPIALGTAALVAAAAGAGVALGTMASARADVAAREPVQVLAAQHGAEAQRLALWSNVSYAVGGVLLAAGGVLLAVEVGVKAGAAPPLRASVTLSVGPPGAGIVLGSSF